MSPKRIDIIIGNPTSKCTLQESKTFWGTPSPSTNIYKYAVVLWTTSSSKSISVLIDTSIKRYNGSFPVHDLHTPRPHLKKSRFDIMIPNGDFMILNDGLSIEKNEKQKKNNFSIFSF